ncbi:MAG: flavin reductase family protein [Rubrivivax sp.]|nr:flavin reductase family protein [Rubrivivax sp.]
MSRGERAEVALAHASRLVNHGPTVLVTSQHAGRRNVMAAAWSMPVEFTPPRIAVVIDKRTFTAELVQASGLVGIDIPCARQADMTHAVGNVSARDLPAGTDKFQRYDIECFTGPALGLPHVAGCIAWMEGRVIREPHTEQAYDTFFVEVAWAAADPRVFRGGKWQFDDANADLHTLHHLGGGVFAVPSRLVRASEATVG